MRPKGRRTIVNTWVYTDADNTLWDTDAVFAHAQLALLDAAERFTGKQAPSTERLPFIRRFDQAIAARHHQRLRYPPVLLARALSEGINGSSPDAAAQRALAQGAVATDDEAEGLRLYSEALSRTPPILPAVQAGLNLAHDRQIPVYVVSEGPLELVRTRLQALGVEGLTSGVLSAQKTSDLYVRLKQRAAPHRAIMIGDQLDRDIRLAREAGLETILVEGRFRPQWIQTSDTSYANAVVGDFLEAIRWAIESDNSSRG